MATILIVDDAAFMRMRLRKTLEDAGHLVVEGGNGREAVAAYKEHHPACVFMDITMPEMDGLQALSEIRRIDPDARVSMLTAIGQQGTIMDAVKAGARDFIIKPFDAERVMTTLNRMLA
jgi:two-component system, chemotaxis family, chemotaxis protein CheY